MGDPRLLLDQWGPDYDGTYNVADPEGTADSSRELEAGVELPEADWRPVQPGPVDHMPVTWFLDGSRRMEARAYLESDSGQLNIGGLGSTAVGAVLVRPGQRAVFEDTVQVRRWCLLGGGAQYTSIELPALPGWPGALRYEPHGVPDAGPEALMQGLQTLMRDQERLLAARIAAADPDALIVLDGPLPGRGASPHMLGYLKTTSVMRLDAEAMRVVRSLKAGERSPIYRVGASGDPTAFFEWWLRLRDPLQWQFSLAGTVRLQLSAAPDAARRLNQAKLLADWSCRHLPGFATLQHQDPRAPQQLLPTRALEAELRRRMGSVELLRRRLLTGHFATVRA